MFPARRAGSIKPAEGLLAGTPVIPKPLILNRTTPPRLLSDATTADPTASAPWPSVEIVVESKGGTEKSTLLAIPNPSIPTSKSLPSGLEKVAVPRTACVEDGLDKTISEVSPMPFPNWAKKRFSVSCGKGGSKTMVKRGRPNGLWTTPQCISSSRIERASPNETQPPRWRGRRDSF